MNSQFIRIPLRRGCARARLTALFALLAAALGSRAADYPPPTPGDFVLKDFHFQDGSSLPEVKMHYLTFGAPRQNLRGTVTNAVLLLHGTGGNSSNFVRASFAGELFGAGQLLDATRCYLIIPDNLGHGQSAKPSDGLHAKFPNYVYRDMILAQYRLLTEGLKVNHLRLVLGTSMGGMHTWLWGETYSEFMDALMPLASLPTQISGRNRVWRRAIIDAIRLDPEWKNGEYTTPPPGLRVAEEVSYFLSSNPVKRYEAAPTLAAADQMLDRSVAASIQVTDANNMLYAFSASQDYDPGPALEKIKSPLLAVNSADDLINPPELRILEREIKRVKFGQAVVIPLSDQTDGHGTHTLAAVWKNHLADLLKKSEHK